MKNNRSGPIDPTRRFGNNFGMSDMQKIADPRSMDISVRGPRLHADDVGFQYHASWWCLHGVGLELNCGELLGIVGPNGSGKSTLLKILAGHLLPKEGEVRLDDLALDQWDRKKFARKVAYLPQSVPAVFPYTVSEIVSQGRYPHQGSFGFMTRNDYGIIEQAMDWTHIRPFANRTLAELSGGERQRVFLASVLAQGARLLLLDEPTTALDLHHQIDIFERLGRLVDEGYGVGLVTHDLNLAAQFCHRLVVLNEGGILVEGSPSVVMKQEVLDKVYADTLMVKEHPSNGLPMVILTNARARPDSRSHPTSGDDSCKT